MVSPRRLPFILGDVLDESEAPARPVVLLRVMDSSTASFSVIDSRSHLAILPRDPLAYRSFGVMKDENTP